jgi:twitching motility protein PilT
MLRIDGMVTCADAEAMTPSDTQELVYSFLTAEQRQRFERSKELDFSLDAGNNQRFRVNVYYQRGAVTAALRPIPGRIPSLDELGLPRSVADFARARQGLVLVTGPTGSGKSTTLAALIDLFNRTRRCHIISIEDPIEYVHKHVKCVVDQREIGMDTDTFPTALKYVLRQDPDVIMIGEMRDLETIRAALTAAETGHLVFATLHTNDAVQTIDRVIDVFPPEQQQQIRFQLSMVLLAIVSQRLIPCRHGGRVLACEIMHNNSAIASLVREHKSHQVYSVMQTAAREGMITMDRAVRQLYAADLITQVEAAALMRNPKELQHAVS